MKKDEILKCPMCKRGIIDKGGLCWTCLWTFDLGGPVALVSRYKMYLKNKKQEAE